MKIFVRYGHSEEFPGASSQYGDEVEIIREYAPYLAQKLYYAGHTVYTFDPDTYFIDYDSADKELMAGVNLANSYGVDLFVSCHVNSISNPYESYTTVLTRSNDNLAMTIGNSIKSTVSNLLGISNSGLQHPTDKGELNYTNMPALIIEPFFVSNQSDCNAYNSVGGQALGEAIADAILACI
ncbi:MAG: N-acetylmuramoyl-L-alanine amidase [Vulcanibacillus sp.]